MQVFQNARSGDMESQFLIINAITPPAKKKHTFSMVIPFIGFLDVYNLNTTIGYSKGNKKTLSGFIYFTD